MKPQILPEKPIDLQPEKCACCGHTRRYHSHSLSQGLVTGLRKFAAAGKGKPLNLNKAGLDRSQWDNFQKLKYWDLVTPTKCKSGIWNVTELGYEFLAGNVSLRKTKITLDGKAVYDHNADVTIQHLQVQPFKLKP
jgi:hypothetical protein